MYRHMMDAMRDGLSLAAPSAPLVVMGDSGAGLVMAALNLAVVFVFRFLEYQRGGARHALEAKVAQLEREVARLKGGEDA